MTLRVSSMVMHWEAIRVGTDRGVLPYVEDAILCLNDRAQGSGNRCQYGIIVLLIWAGSVSVRAVIDWVKAVFAER